MRTFALSLPGGLEMVADEFKQRIRAAFRLLNDRMGLLRSVSSIDSLRVDTEFNAVALAPERSYREIYLAAVSRSYYNFILTDYSLFQYSWLGATNWRLAFFPNPWIAGVPGAAERVADWEALEGLGQYDDEEVSQLISELPYYGSVPPLRFEHAVSQYRELSHPAAHLHIGRHTENRWPSSKVLNPLSFTQLILKMYYVQEWASCSAYYGGQDPCLDLEFVQELQRSQRVHEFTETESRSFHLNAR